MSKTIEILISPKGETTVTTKGFVGGECREASKFIEKALGETLSDKNTVEFCISQTAQQSIQDQSDSESR